MKTESQWNWLLKQTMHLKGVACGQFNDNEAVTIQFAEKIGNKVYMLLDHGVIDQANSVGLENRVCPGKQRNVEQRSGYRHSRNGIQLLKSDKPG